MRLHPYYTERILARCSPLAALVEPASSHHERVDGSGYHRSLSAEALSRADRILAAADAFAAMTAERPHRPALAADDASRALESEAGRKLDADAVGCVLAAAGQRATHTVGAVAGRPHRPRGGGASPHLAGPVEPRGRAAAVHLAEDGGAPRRERVREDRGLVARRGCRLRDGAPASRLRRALRKWGVHPMRAAPKGRILVACPEIAGRSGRAHERRSDGFRRASKGWPGDDPRQRCFALLRGARCRGADPVYPRHRQLRRSLGRRGCRAGVARAHDRLRPTRLLSQRAPGAVRHERTAAHRRCGGLDRRCSRPLRRS